MHFYVSRFNMFYFTSRQHYFLSNCLQLCSSNTFIRKDLDEECKSNKNDAWLANIAPWFCLPLPSCGPRFKSQAHHLSFFQFYYWNCNEKITKINKNRSGLAHLKIIIKMMPKIWQNSWRACCAVKMFLQIKVYCVIHQW